MTATRYSAQPVVLYEGIAHKSTAQAVHVEETYRKLVLTIRELIKGLRPAMLSYGLRVAHNDLVDNLDKRHPAGPFWEIDFSGEDFRYESTVEQHLFRIMKQACENVLRHAQAETIWVPLRPQESN